MEVDPGTMPVRGAGARLPSNVQVTLAGAPAATPIATGTLMAAIVPTTHAASAARTPRLDEPRSSTRRVVMASPSSLHGAYPSTEGRPGTES